MMSKCSTAADVIGPDASGDGCSLSKRITGIQSGSRARRALGALCGLGLAAAPVAAGAGDVTAELQQRLRGATFEVVLAKPERDPLSYEKPLPLELLPYIERADAYRSIGTAFALGHNTYVTAGHVLVAGVASQYGAPQLRGADGRVHAIDRVLRFSAHEDFAVFSLADDPEPAPLDVNREPRIDDPVLAVGNALGEGIVIRDGLYTSATPEEQDGRWKWIRFSAAASPGNSGGPLLDAAGRVIGIVIGKSPNENLNYSLPIGRALDAAGKAGFELRALQGLPFLRGTRTYAIKDEFTLPKSWKEFALAYAALIERHGDRARAELLAAYADSTFPRGKGVEQLLYGVEAAYFPRLIAQGGDDSWSADELGYARTDLGDDGFVGVASQRGITLLRLHRPGNAADAAWYADSRGFMDLALKGLGITRQVGSDAVRVTSLGAALADTRYVDHYGRRWQERSWAVPYLDAYVVGLLLPTPDGYVGLLQFTPGLMLPEARKRIELLADLFYVSYWGSLQQWRAFLARREALPDALGALRLEPEPKGAGWRLATPRCSVDLAPTLMAVDAGSMLGLQMAYVPDAGGAAWSIGALAWYQDEAEKNYLVLGRQLHPPAGANRELRDRWSDLVGRRSPYNGAPTRDGASAWTMHGVIDVPGARAGSLADDLVYWLTVHTENRAQYQDVIDMKDLALQAVHVLEHGSGVRAAAAAATPAADAGAGGGPITAQLDRRLAAMDVYLGRLADYGRQVGRDLRGRELADDLRDYVANADGQSRVRKLRDGIAAAEGAGRAGDMAELGTELDRLLWQRGQRVDALLAYWPNAAELRSLDAGWPAFLARNRLPAVTPQSAAVSELWGRLRATLAGEAGTENVAALVEQLQSAYRGQRKELYERIRAAQPPGGPEFHDRASACPAPVPVTDSGGATRPVRVNVDRGVDDYYPAESRRVGETGSVLLAIRVDARGCAQAVAVLVSSGFERLDAAALRWIQEAATFVPAIAAGSPVDSVKELAVTFRLNAGEFALPGAQPGS
jgi:TonB family protein